MTKKTLKTKAQTTTAVAKPAASKAAAPAAPVNTPTKPQPAPAKVPAAAAPKAAPAPAPKAPAARTVTAAPKAVATSKQEPAKPAAVLAAEAPKPAPAPKPEPKAPPAKAFELEAPQASTVLLAGDFTGWDAKPIALSKEGNGRWKAKVTLAPGKYQYRFIVDGTWTDDPQAPSRITNPFGTVNCVCEVGSN